MWRLLVVGAVLLLAVGCTAVNNTAAPAATVGTPGVGRMVRVGSLDLTVTAVRAVDTKPFNQFNASDTAVDLQMTNARGGSSPYNFNAYLALKVVDGSGVAHSPELSCASCPNALASVDLVKGGHTEGAVYFKMGGAPAVAVTYAPLGSANKVTIPVNP